MRSSTLIAMAVTFALAGCGGGGAAPLTGGGGPGQTDGELASFAISHPEGAVTVGDTLIMQITARDVTGQPLTGGQTQFSSTDATVATVDAAGVVRGVKAGASTITGSMALGGVTRTATFSIAVLAAPAPPPANPPPTNPPPANPPPANPPPPTAPSAATVQGVEDAFSPSSVTIAAGGTVTWTMVDEEHDVTWTGAAPTGGNIGRIDRGQSVSRTFPNAGTYAYTCGRHDGDHGGTVTVQDAAQAVFTSVRITPASPSVAVGAMAQLTATPVDQQGRAMAGLPAATWTTSDASKATVSAAGVVTGVAAGTATITARITQGVTREGTATVTVGGGTTPNPPPPTAPTTATVTTPGTTFSPANVTIATGGSVTWQFTGSTRHNVTFNGTAPAGGNIPDTDAGGSASRTFTAAGTYAYTCTRHSGMNGTVVVQP